jgi:hypothetical protein
MIERDQIDKVEGMLRSNGASGLPPNLEVEWIEIEQSLLTGLDAFRAKAFQKWAAQVDDLAKDVRQRCLDAKTSADLDPLLVRCAALQMQRLGQDNVAGQRAARKMAGVAGTLENWANYLDFRAAGNAVAANGVLRAMTTAGSQFPVLTMDDIQARFMSEKSDRLTMEEAFERVFDGVKSAEDLSVALERMDHLSGLLDPAQLNGIQGEKIKIKRLQSAAEALRRGDEEGAIKSLNDLSSTGGLAFGLPEYDRIKLAMVRPLLISKCKKYSDLQIGEGEGPEPFLRRVIDQLFEKGEFAAMGEVMKLGERLLRSAMNNPAFATDRGLVERFAAGQRFETAGDFLSAVNEYRLVVGATGGIYAPAKQAGEALRRLKEKHPEVFTDSEGFVLSELRALRQQIEILATRPGYPGPMYPPNMRR